MKITLSDKAKTILSLLTIAAATLLPLLAFTYAYAIFNDDKSQGIGIGVMLLEVAIFYAFIWAIEQPLYKLLLGKLNISRKTLGIFATHLCLMALILVSCGAARSFGVNHPAVYAASAVEAIVSAVTPLVLTIFYPKIKELQIKFANKPAKQPKEKKNKVHKQEIKVK